MKIQFIPIAFFLLLIAAGCKKDTKINSSVPTNGNTIVSPLSAFFAENAAPIQTFTLIADSGGSIVGTNGTKVTFPQYYFTKGNNNQIVTGIISVQLIEILTKKDMILSNRTTTSNGSLLISAGEVYLKVTQNNQELKPNKYSDPYQISLPASSTSANMEVFNGSINSSNEINWRLADTVNINDSLNPHSNYVSNNPAFYTMFVDSLHWLNGDYFYPNHDYDTIKVHISGGADPLNTILYVLVNGTNSLTSLRNFYGNNYYFKGYVLGNTNLTIVGIGLDANKNLYSVFFPLNVSTDTTLNILLSQVTKADLLTQLNNLP